MANTFIDHKDAWLRMSDIDYLGQFVKTWLSFNAWYRSAYSETQDRQIINEIKWQGNPVLSKLRPLLETDSEEAEQFRAEIGLLHNRLEGYEIHSGKAAEKKRISLRSVYLRDNPPVTKKDDYYRCSYQVQRFAGGQMAIEVKGPTGNMMLQHSQNSFDLLGLQALPAYGDLPQRSQSLLKEMYSEAVPRWTEDLITFQDVDPTTREIKCGAYSFRCGRNALFAGIVETVYQMRCTLFHGELVPTKETVMCYEPASRIVRRFLECVA